MPPHRGRMSGSLVSWSPPGPASPRSVRNTPLPGPGREGAPQGLGEVARTTPCLAGLRGGFHAGKSSGQSQTLAWLPASCPRWGPQFLSRDPQPPAPESLVVQGGDAGAQPGCKGSKHRHGGGAALPSFPPRQPCVFLTPEGASAIWTVSGGRRVRGLQSTWERNQDHGARRGQSSLAGVGVGVSPPRDSLGCMVGGRAWSHGGSQGKEGGGRPGGGELPVSRGI